MATHPFEYLAPAAAQVYDMKCEEGMLLYFLFSLTNNYFDFDEKERREQH